MSRKYKFKDNDKLCFITFAVVYWIDIFIREEYKTIVLNSWKYCIQNKGMELYGWCIMTSHIHMIIGSHADKLERIMQNMKRHTSEHLKKSIKNNPEESRREWIIWMMERAGKKNSNINEFQLWQQHNNPIELSNQKTAWQKLEYIHENPVRLVLLKSRKIIYTAVQETIRG